MALRLLQRLAAAPPRCASLAARCSAASPPRSASRLHGSAAPQGRAVVRAMASATAGNTVKIAVSQMTSTADAEANFAACARLARSASDAGAALLCLPECCTFLGMRDTDALAVAEALDGPLMARFGALAREHGLWLSLGGLPEASALPGRRYNTHVLFDSEGRVTASYRKVHLFDVDIPGRVTLKESNVTLAGDELVAADSPVGRLGLTVCYDLRFPAVYQRLVFEQGARVLLIPAAFTRPTGEAHWETLLRARAIETQCYVAAAAQAGQHNDKRASYGHAMVVDPWGAVVARCADPDSEGIAVAEVDAAWLATVRERMPVATHRRTDVYDKPAPRA